MNQLPEKSIHIPDQILERIVQNARILQTRDGSPAYTLFYGKKELHVIFDLREATVSTRIYNTGYHRAETGNETTIIYAAAKKIIERYARELGKDFFYKFQTNNESMGAWAKTKGAEVFDFSPIEDLTRRFRYNYCAIIYCSSDTERPESHTQK